VRQASTDQPTSLTESAEQLTGGQRALSLVEFLMGGAIVIAHNVFHAIPNEVPILLVLGIVSIWLRARSWRAIGFARPNSWLTTVGVALIAAVVIIAVGQFVTDPLAKTMGLHENAGAAANALGPLHGRVWNALKGLGLVWTFAAFGEEISYRRYLLGRAADVAGGTTLAHWIALPVVSILFGFGHYYQGAAGIFTTACDGFLIGAAYLLMKRNLWVATLTHGLIDTIGIALLFFGLAN
jgi:membrane protease YdiL (CAAX protease family)